MSQAPLSCEVGWRVGDFCIAAALVAAAVAVWSNAWSDILLIARRDEEASQIFLVPPAFLWIMFVRRSALRSCRLVGCGVGPLLIGTGWLLWSGGYRYDIQAFWHGGAVTMAAGAALTVFGADLLRKFWPAFLVLVFLVPIPGCLRQEIARPMQTVTAQATQSIAELFGMLKAILDPNVAAAGTGTVTAGTPRGGKPS